MKTIFFSIIISLLAFTACSSNQTLNESPSDQVLLYRISGNELEEASFIFGTLHFIPSERFFIPDTVIKSFETSDAVVLETNIDIPLKEQVAIAQRTLLTPPETLADYLSADVYQEALNYMTDSLGMSDKKAERFMKLKPMFLMGPVLNEYYGKLESYEKEFLKMAKKNDQTMLFLEDIEFQLNLLDSIPMDLQVKDFSIEAIIAEYGKMLDVYLEQDLDKLGELIYENEDFMELEEDIMITRNEKWIPLLEEMMESQSIFAAVGAGHLYGEKGVLALLEKEGYKVDQVDLK